MISIGNDIVDLSAIDKHRTQQKAFYSKILSDKEQQLYSRSSHLPFEIYVWLLWSAKESVYKFAKRLHPGLVFSPVRIQFSEPGFSEFKNFQNSDLTRIQLELSPSKFGKSLNPENPGSDNISEYSYQINYQSDTYYLRSLISNSFIATIASDFPNFPKIHWGIKHIEQTGYESQSAVVREFILKRLNDVFPTEANLSIGKSPVGYPIILEGQNETELKVSFAHHGHYVAYAFGT